jgi:hypothetical protein
MGVTGDSTPRIVEMSSGQDLMSCISSFGSTKHGEISKRKLHKITNFYKNVLTCIVSNIVSIFSHGHPWPSMAFHVSGPVQHHVFFRALTPPQSVVQSRPRGSWAPPWYSSTEGLGCVDSWWSHIDEPEIRIFMDFLPSCAIYFHIRVK